MSSIELESMEEAIKTLEVMVKGWNDPIVPPDHFVEGIDVLERWKKEILSITLNPEKK